MLGLCDCGDVFNYRIGGVRVEIAEAMVWRGVLAEMLMQVSCCIGTDSHGLLARSSCAVARTLRLDSSWGLVSDGRSRRLGLGCQASLPCYQA